MAASPTGVMVMEAIRNGMMPPRKSPISAGVFAEARHLRDAANVVGNRPVRIHCHGHADGGEQAHGGDADAVESGEFGRDEDDAADGEERYDHGLHAHREAGDHDGGGPGFSRLGDAFDGFDDV